MEAYMMGSGTTTRDKVQAHSTLVMGMCSKVHGGMMLCTARDGFIFTLGIDGLQIFGREKPKEKAASILSLVMYFLASSQDGLRHSDFLCIDVDGTRKLIQFLTLFVFLDPLVANLWIR